MLYEYIPHPLTVGIEVLPNFQETCCIQVIKGALHGDFFIELPDAQCEVNCCLAFNLFKIRPPECNQF